MFQLLTHGNYYVEDFTFRFSISSYMENDMRSILLSDFLSRHTWIITTWSILLSDFLARHACKITREVFFIFRFSSPSYVENYYVKPYCRAPPYFIGIMTGYILHRTRCELELSHVSPWCFLIGWLVTWY